MRLGTALMIARPFVTDLPADGSGGDIWPDYVLNRIGSPTPYTPAVDPPENCVPITTTGPLLPGQTYCPQPCVPSSTTGPLLPGQTYCPAPTATFPWYVESLDPNLHPSGPSVEPNPSDSIIPGVSNAVLFIGAGFLLFAFMRGRS